MRCFVISPAQQRRRAPPLRTAVTHRRYAPPLRTAVTRHRYVPSRSGCNQCNRSNRRTFSLRNVDANLRCSTSGKPPPKLFSGTVICGHRGDQALNYAEWEKARRTDVTSVTDVTDVIDGMGEGEANRRYRRYGRTSARTRGSRSYARGRIESRDR